MRRHVLFLLAMTLGGSTAAAATADTPSAQALLKRVASEGGHKVLWDLWDNEQAFSRVITGIESADPSWLKVAAALKPSSDAGASLSLNYAVASALPKAPDRVLALIQQGFKMDDICTSPFIEPDPGVAEAYERKTLKALATVKTGPLAPVAAACAERVRLDWGVK